MRKLKINMQNLLEELKKLLAQDERLVFDGKLLNNKIIELSLKVDADFIKLLLKNEPIKKFFFQEIDDVLIFDKIKFQNFISNKAFLPDKYILFKNNELIKIKEDAIKIQEQDVQDTVESIENENSKSSFVLGFAGILFGFVFNQIDKLLWWQAIGFVSLLLCSIGFALWNITAKKVDIHTNVDEIFVNNEPREWVKYLKNKHERLCDIYKGAKILLYQKVIFTKLSFVLLILSSLFLVLIKIWR